MSYHHLDQFKGLDLDQPPKQQFATINMDTITSS